MTVAGVLLTGGESRRLGSPKAALVVQGERLADRASRALQTVCTPVLEVGPGFSSLPAVREDPPGSGPLAALATALDALTARGHEGPAIALAVDLPAIDAAIVGWLARHPATESVVPMVAGRAQPLCARYAPVARATAQSLVVSGERSMQALLAAIDVRYVDEGEWGGVCDASAFFDIDTAADAARAGAELPAAAPDGRGAPSR